MKKIEKIILDEKEQEIYMNFIDLIVKMDRCLGEDYSLMEKLTDFRIMFDEIVEEW